MIHARGEVLDYAGGGCDWCGAHTLALHVPPSFSWGMGRRLCASCMRRGRRYLGAACVALVLITGLGMGTLMWMAQVGAGGGVGVICLMFPLWFAAIMAVVWFYNSQVARQRRMWASECLVRLNWLDSSGKWTEAWQEGQMFLREGEGWGEPGVVGQAFAQVEGWMAVADVWMGRDEDLQQADQLSKHALEMLRTSPQQDVLTAMKASRACVLMALGREAEAEEWLKQVPAEQLKVGAGPAVVRLCAELCRRKGDQENQALWEAQSAEVDPEETLKGWWQRRAHGQKVEG